MLTSYLVNNPYILARVRGSTDRAQQGLTKTTKGQYSPVRLFACFVISLTFCQTKFGISSFRFGDDRAQIYFSQFQFRNVLSVIVAEILQAVFLVNRLLSKINAVVPCGIEHRIKSNQECPPVE